MPHSFSSRVSLIGLLFVAALPAQNLAVGDPAPAIAANSWLNWEGEPPTVASLAGRVILLEFWGTWCGPCVRAMPGIQKLHDRYRDRGLTVLAFTYESSTTVQPFLTTNAYTLPVACDTGKKTIGAYPIRGWPTTIVIDKAGKVAHIGSPYDAEAAVERALGLEAGPAALLTTYLDSLKGASKTAQRDALERLCEKAPPDFDLQAWAKGHSKSDAVAEEGAPPLPAQPLPVDVKANEAADLLRRCADAWVSKETQRTQLLEQLGAAGPSQFDLAAFAQETLSKAFPFDAAELKALLKDKQYAAVVEAIAQRTPPAPVIATAAKDKGLATFCKGKLEEVRSMAKKGLMAQLWVFPGALPKDEKVNKAFFNELSISGIATSADKKSIIGIMLGGEQVKREQVDTFVTSNLRQSLLMEDLARNKTPPVHELTKLVDRQRGSIVRDLESRYGKPEPRAN